MSGRLAKCQNTLINQIGTRMVKGLDKIINTYYMPTLKDLGNGFYSRGWVGEI